MESSLAGAGGDVMHSRLYIKNKKKYFWSEQQDSHRNWSKKNLRKNRSSWGVEGKNRKLDRDLRMAGNAIC